MAGSAINGGCPEIETLKTWLNRVAKNIFFETASARLLPHSFSALDSLASLLNSYPVLLCEKRANAVMTCLIKTGISATRLHAYGYCQQKPVADNSTNDGRAKNRRVQLKRDDMAKYRCFKCQMWN
jgi:OmpA-OmpF porin, OOP family